MLSFLLYGSNYSLAVVITLNAKECIHIAFFEVTFDLVAILQLDWTAVSCSSQSVHHGIR